MEERRQPSRPKTGEAPFGLDEVFYSKTDDRGVIESGNHVFSRVSGYDWDELIGAPHKIVRHPDMPKAVFWLLWERLKEKRPVGAYVKNRAKDGLHYWVFAAAMPSGSGYLSARIKPSSPLLKTVEDLYADLRRKEFEDRLSPEDSSTYLLEQLRSLGFATYEQFASHALGVELSSRNAGLGLAPDQRIENFTRLANLSDDLVLRTSELVAEFDTVKIIPQNMRIIASRLEPSGGPISTLSQNYGLMSEEISQWFERNVIGANSNFSTIKDSVTTSMFNQCMAGILQACITCLATDRRDLNKVDIISAQADLAQLVEKYTTDSVSKLSQATREADRIVSACQDMRRHALGLNTTRIMAKIEGARSLRDGAALQDVISQLKTFQTRIDSLLSDIADHGEDIRTIASQRDGIRPVKTQGRTTDLAAAS